MEFQLKSGGTIQCDSFIGCNKVTTYVEGKMVEYLVIKYKFSSKEKEIKIDDIDKIKYETFLPLVAKKIENIDLGEEFFCKIYATDFKNVESNKKDEVKFIILENGDENSRFDGFQKLYGINPFQVIIDNFWQKFVFHLF
jgi:uncharacterized protein involved in high-affinity Fe2+ transport